MNKKTVRDFDLKGKRVLVRVDFNVPMEDGKITDDNRIVQSLKTINYLLEKGAKVILMSHLGRPKGKPNQEMSLGPVAKRLSELLNKEVFFFKSDRVVDQDVKNKVASLKDGQVALLENTRFVEGEEKNSEEFAKELASLGDIYINDAFGTSHRAHASNVGVSKFLPSGIGFLLEKEVVYLSNTIANPERPFVAILGGKKVSDKIGVIENLLNVCDKIIIVGGMAYTFLKSMGLEIGNSIVEDDKLDLARQLMASAIEKNVELILPSDILITDEIKAGANTKVVSRDEIPQDGDGVDIGPESIKNIKNVLKDAKTVIWNGPCGIFEIEDFSKGTFALAEILANLKDATTIIGGGDSAHAIELAGLSDKMTHISTGGGASLELMEGKILPGLAAIEDKNSRQALIAGNWKMNKSPSEAECMIEELLKIDLDKEVEALIAPPFTAIGRVSKLLKDSDIKVGAQNVNENEDGAYTGEISISMLKDLNVKYVIVGHSERRNYYKESNQLVNAKAEKVLEGGMTPIICLGESQKERLENRHFEVVGEELKESVKNLKGNFVIAYEPIWAIGTGNTCSSQDAQDMCKFIRESLSSINRDYENTRILYGGSVKPENIKELMNKEDIDGALVGGASLKASDFAKLVNFRK